MNLKESERQKHYYDRKMRCQKLIVGDVVLVKEKGSSSNYKINDKWEVNPYMVLEHMTDNKGQQMPIFWLWEVVKEGTPCTRKHYIAICYTHLDLWRDLRIHC